MSDYQEFLSRKSQIGRNEGFEPLWIPDFLFDFQRSLVEWSVRKGRAAIFADCGLGKTPMQLVWAENVRRHTGKPVLIITPIAVGRQTVAEGEKFGIEATISRDGKHNGGIVVTNYERLHHFDSNDFGGIVCDESSIIKNCNGATRKLVTEFLRTRQYRLLCTATAAPNDWHELGTSSEALGNLGFRDMITTFFKQETSKDHRGWGRTKYRFKEHAKIHFWRWVCSWARAVRKPSDLGFDDAKFQLPALTVNEHKVTRRKTREGFLFSLPAKSLEDQREERRATIGERCELVAGKVAAHGGFSVVWCHLNSEGDLLEKLIPDCVQVSGGDSDDAKEEKLTAFSAGDVKRLVIKPKIGAWGLNWQHCNYMTTFPSHSYEQYYQSVRRCWRFGQTRPVSVDIVTTDGEESVVKNLQRKSEQTDEMFSALVAEMNRSMDITTSDNFHERERIPSWL